LILEAISNAAVIASLGASSFIAFTMPHAKVSSPRFIIGGHVVSVGAGSLCHWLSRLASLTSLPVLADHSLVVFAAVATGLAMFVMVVTDTEHPPAAGVALGLVVGDCRPITIAVILIGVVVLSVLRTVLKPILKNLL
jgi:CBS-domain-containing membrane protein